MSFVLFLVVFGYIILAAQKTTQSSLRNISDELTFSDVVFKIKDGLLQLCVRKQNLLDISLFEQFSMEYLSYHTVFVEIVPSLSKQHKDFINITKEDLNFKSQIRFKRTYYVITHMRSKCHFGSKFLENVFYDPTAFRLKVSAKHIGHQQVTFVQHA